MTRKIAVVTGGTRGIGLAISRLLLDRGYRVVASYASDEAAAEAARALGIHTVKANQGLPGGIAPLVEAVRASGLQVGAIVGNAGATVRRPMREISDSEWLAAMNVNVNSHFFLIRDLTDLIAPDSRIIFIGSMMGIHPHATSLAYGVGKAALHAMAANMVKEFAAAGTTVNAIAPGFVETEWQSAKPADQRERICAKTAAGRFCTPEEVARAVAFCIDNPFVNGTTLEISGGYSCR